MDLIASSSIALLGTTPMYASRLGNDLSVWKTFVFLLIFQYSVIKLYRILIYPELFSPLRHLPGPKKNTILLGQELAKYKSESPVHMQLQWSRTWPKAPFIRYLSIAGREVLLVNNLEAHKAVLQTQCYDFVKPRYFVRLTGEIVGQGLGAGLLFAEGEHHKQERRLMSGPFSVPNVKKLVPVFQRKAADLSRVFELELGDDEHASMDVNTIFSKATMDIIGVTCLGVELKSLSSSQSSLGFHELFSRLLRQGPLGSLIWVANAFMPVRRFMPFEANKRFTQANRDIRTLLYGVIRQRIQDMEHAKDDKSEISESRDLLSYMLEEGIEQQRETGKAPWTENDIAGHLLTFLVAGHETSAGALTWASYVLATKHQIQEKLRTEVQELLENHPVPDYADLFDLPYLHNFCREILRLYSPAVMVFREVIRDLQIENVNIPKGTTLEVSPHIMNLNTEVWGPDARVFDPDRWDHLDDNAANPYAWETFIQGPRICPGKNFSLAEIKAILIVLVSRWRFVGIEKNDGSGYLLGEGDVEVSKGIKLANPAPTYYPSGGLRVRFERLG